MNQRLKGLEIGLTAQEMAGAIDYYLKNSLILHSQYSPIFNLKGEIKRTPDGGLAFIISSPYISQFYHGNFHPSLIGKRGDETSPEEYRNNIVNGLITELKKLDNKYAPSMIVGENPLEFSISIPRPQRTERPSTSPLARTERPAKMTLPDILRSKPI